ncbi:MAG TPA: acyltransferase [Ruania sp.]|nr:acyltransferase [Ruania sp.]
MTNPTATTSRTPTPVQRRGRLRAMDALRLLAALAVVLFHFTTRDHGRWGAQLPHEVFPALSHVVRYGYAGVHLFFTISGFVILMSVWGRSPRQFVASRISRLYPAFWVAVLATATLRWWWPAFSGRSIREVLANLTMFHEPFGIPSVDGVYWTLWVEMQFYLLMLVMAFLGITRRRVLTVAFALPLVCTVLVMTVPHVDARATALSWAPLFAAGMVLYVIFRDGHTWQRWALVGLNTAQAMLVGATHKIHVIDAVASGEHTSALLFSLVVLGTIAAVAAVALVPAVRDLDWQVLTFLGALTYPLYLLHEYFGWTLIQVLHPVLGKWLTLTAAVALSLLLAWLVHRFVERPVHRPLRKALEGAGRPAAH